MIITSTPEALRAWAKGMYTTEAAAELLIRGFGGRFVQTAYPWIHPSESGGYWIELAAIPDNIGAYSSGERGFLLIAASIGSSEVQVNLSDAVASLGREQLDLVLAAIAHAAGSHQHSEILYDPDGRPASFGKLDTLYPWPG
jgi:hypothetical protein